MISLKDLLTRRCASTVEESDSTETMFTDRAEAEAELQRSREEHAYAVKQRIDLQPLNERARELSSLLQKAKEKNGFTTYLLESFGGQG